MVRDMGVTMPSLYDRQVKACSMLESAETQLMKTAAQQRAKAIKQQGAQAKREEKGKAVKKPVQGPVDYDPEREGSIADQLVPRANRPTHRVGAWLPLPGMGKKIDTIDWAKDELVNVTVKLEEERSHLAERPVGSAAFIEFRTQVAAHMFQQATIHNLPLRMAGRYVEVGPADVIFGNLNVNPCESHAERIGF